MWGNLLESIGNFVTGHGFQDNRGRANEDAQNAARVNSTTTAGVRRQVSTPRPLNTNLFNNPLTPNLNPTVPNAPITQRPLFENPTAMQPSVNQSDVAKAAQKIKATGTGVPYAPKVINAAQKLNTKPAPQSTMPKPEIDYSNPFVWAGEFGKEWLGNAKKMVVDPVVNTAKLPADLAMMGYGRLTGNKGITERADKALGENFDSSLLSPLNFIRPLGASIAYNEQYNKIVNDPNTDQWTKDWLLANLTNSVNQETASMGVNTENPAWLNNLMIGGNAALTVPTMLSASNGISGMLNAPSKYVGNAESKMLMQYLRDEPKIIADLSRAAQANDTAAFRAVADRMPFNNTRQLLMDVADQADNLKTTPKMPNVAKLNATNPIATDAGMIPAKPQTVVALDRGGSISAPVRAQVPPSPVIPRINETPALIPSAPVEAPLTNMPQINRAPAPIQPTEPLPLPVANDVITAPSNLLVSHEGAPDLKTVAEYKAQIQAGQPIEPIKVIREGDKYGIEDGKHRFQAYQELGIKDVPIELVEAPAPKAPITPKAETPQMPVEQASAEAAQNAILPVETKTPLATADGTPFDPTQSKLGSVVQSYVQAGGKIDDVAATDLATAAAEMAQSEAKALGTTFESIMDRYHKIWESKGKKTPAQVGLSDEEYNLAKNFVNEQTYLRNRADPSLVTGGTVKGYAPRQYVDTEYTPDLVNELHRSKNSSLTHSELDLTTTPIEQAIRRYGNAEKVVSDSVIDIIENKTLKNPNGVVERVETGIKIPEQARADFSVKAKEYIAKKDQIEVELAKGDLSKSDIDRLGAEMNKTIDDGFNQLMENIPKDTAEGRLAIARLTAQRGAYLQGAIRSNMFSNIVVRAIDQVQAAIIKSSNTFMNISDTVSSKVLGTEKAFATGRDARSVARQYSKGALKNEIAQDFRTNMSTADGKNVLGKLDIGYRAGSTALTSAGDLTTQTVRMTNLMTLARAQAEGVTGRANLEAYLRKSLNSPEYAETLQGVRDAYAGYVSLPTSIGSKVGNEPKFFSKIDNAVNNGLKNLGVSPRVARELNDLIMPALSGFSGAVYRVGAKSANAMLGGVPGVIRGLKLIRAGGETSRQLGQMMISRSLIDGAIAGGAAAISTGAILSGVADWTGEYPSDPNERARWEREGIVPNAIAIDTGDGNTIQIQPGRFLGAFALPVVLPMVIASGGSFDEAFNGTMGQMLENMGAENILKNASYISQALTGTAEQKKYATERLIASAGFSMSNVVPAAGFVNNIASGTDEYKRDTSGSPIDVIKNRIPGARETLPVKTDNLGTPIKNNVQASLGSSLISVAGNGAKSGDGSGVQSLNDEINRLADAKFEVMPANEVKSKNAEAYANLLLSSKLYSGASDEDKADMLHDVLLGTTTKDVNTSLNDTEKQALIEYTVQSEAKRSVWLEDNDNALNYYQGTYNNEKANSTLTAADRSMENTGSLAQKVAIAGVNKKYGVTPEAVTNYADTSKTEFNDLEDGSAEKEALMAYDQALVAAGLPSKYQNKYGGYGASGGGSNGYGSISFAKPLSATDAVAIKSQSLSTMADPFSNIVKSAPSTKTNLKRNISVNKGVHL